MTFEILLYISTVWLYFLTLRRFISTQKRNNKHSKLIMVFGWIILILIGFVPFINMVGIASLVRDLCNSIKIISVAYEENLKSAEITDKELKRLQSFIYY